ncbi:hypothetical protein KVR01_005236 [Diaporthe batatas]|uniref:uncharacterized protein n=1 Tax=Diaporthe batatas TaxID=748121 RepID=UPI001D050F38|nr:uncharacterized protein KVR01_005236 [Diaporthe batatas]KAG8164961.1 hypothetical protein KVR01_005236 [Diaporthe batatas]
MPVKSLVQLCQATVRKHIDQVDYVSTLPYWRVKDPILKHIKNASQLAVIEENSPQIVGEDSELWEAMCKRDFMVPMKRDPREPEDPRAWRQVYEYYAEEERKKEAVALEQLGASFAGLNKMKMANKTAIGDPRKLPKAPTGGLAFGRSRGKGAGPGATLTFGGGGRTSNAVKKAKREALEVAARKRLSVPKNVRQTGNLAKVTQAPESMRAEARIRAQPKFVPPGSSNATKRQREEDDDRSEMESRLLAAKRPKVQPKTMSNQELRPGSSGSVEGSHHPITSRSEPKPSTTPSKPRGLFSRPHGATIQQTKVTTKTFGKPGPGTAAQSIPKTKASLPGRSAGTRPSYSAGQSASPPTQRSSRPEPPRATAASRNGTDVSRFVSPGIEAHKPRKIAPPKRSSRSPSVASSIFGSPEPEASGPSGRRSSFSSRSSSSPAPQQARPTQRPNTPPTASSSHAPRPDSPPKRKVDDAPTAGEGRSAAHPSAKKKKVDIFMRRKR